jgi:uncharacterized protein (TIGR02145 family)
MKKLFGTIMVMTLIYSCTKDGTDQVWESLVSKKGENGKITVCHKQGNGSYHSITISRNALAAHKAHGDVVPDEDGDGYTKENPCGIGQGNDCNDNDPKINPGVKEVCGNGKDDNCDGTIDELCLGVVKICDQIWMASNLDLTTYRDGTLIPEIKDELTWANANYGAWCYYALNTSNGTIYGKLYNWYAVNGDSNGDGVKDKELAPQGWHIPSDAEWNTLAQCLGGANQAGGALKQSGSLRWTSPNTGATNSSGFTALPGGSRSLDGSFSFNNIGQWGFWWSSTSASATTATIRYLSYSSALLGSNNDDMNFGFSVRLVKD